LHPVTVERMQRAVREGRAESVEDAFDVVKNDLKKTNADVSVTQEEFDEIMAIKPVFLVRDYA
ncbi:MAG: ATPase P, partial [Clostridium sp.]